MSGYILAIDQSTQGTKAFLVDRSMQIVRRANIPHRQIISRQGWVSHDLDEIYANLLSAVKKVVEDINVNAISCVGLTNQRETACAWDHDGKPLANAVVWQCSRAQAITERLQSKTFSEYVKSVTGLPLSPYYAGPKLAWLLQNEPGFIMAQRKGTLHLGTVDSYLIYRLTGRYLTDVTNASRTMLMDLQTMQWDADICGALELSADALPHIMPCDEHFGWTDFEGLLPSKIPIMAVMGDSHAAFYGQNCVSSGDTKATYGTGSSVMMNIGSQPRDSGGGIVTTIGYSYQGKVAYAYEGNINYSGAVISWLKDQVGLIKNPAETEELAIAADPNDTTCLIPAFSGLAAPYDQPCAKAILTGMTRITGRNEIVRAALESIAFQIRDISVSMERQAGLPIKTLFADGGAVGNRYLMQFQADILSHQVAASQEEALSALGVAQMAGRLAPSSRRKTDWYTPCWAEELRGKKLAQWAEAIAQCSNSFTVKEEHYET